MADQRRIQRRRSSSRDAPDVQIGPVADAGPHALDVDRLARLAELLEQGILSREEYEEQKAEILRADD